MILQYFGNIAAMSWWCVGSDTGSDMLVVVAVVSGTRDGSGGVKGPKKE